MATPTYTPIATQTLGSAAASITFSSIPGTYTDLRLVLTGLTSAADVMCLQFNGDTATNYSGVDLYGNGASAGSSAQTAVPYHQLNFHGATSITIPTTFGVDIFSYAGSTNKTLLSNASMDFNGSGNVDLMCSLWRSTAAITSIKIGCLGGATNLSTGFTATLWGI